MTRAGLLGITLVFGCSSHFSVATTAANAAADTMLYAAEREQFVKAREALAAGDVERVDQLRSRLEGYPLYHYLVYEQLRSEMHQREPGKRDVRDLNAFEKLSGDKALTRKLTRALQKRLIKAENWRLFLGVSKSAVAAHMPCASLRARAETGQLKGFDPKATALWVKPVKQPALCAGILQRLEANHTPPIKAIWERIYAAMEANKPTYAKSQLNYLGKRDRKRVEAWLKARKSPQTYLQSAALGADTALNRRILVDLVLRWSRDDTVAAMQHWQRVEGYYTFYADRHYDTFRLLAMRGAYRRLPEAYDWLHSFEARDKDLELKEWRIRAALFNQDWPAVMRGIHRLPQIEQEEDHWAYWEARALEQAGKAAKATAIYTTLAELQSYHGFLAADRLGLKYAISDVPINPDAKVMARVSDNPAFIRAREYHHVKLPWEGRREWNQALKQSTKEEMAASALLADSWGLHDRAIFSAGRAEEKRALTLRFPVLYRTQVATAAQENRIDPAWVFGVMRRESAYIADVKSGAGAVGLMQIMPRTATFVAKLQGVDNWRGDLTDADTSIGMGSYYLRHVLDKFDDHVVLATASYNAGPNRVKKWLPDEDMDADIWIDAIPYTETRRYVRAVLAYTAIYEWQLTRKPTRLQEKLLTVAAETGA